MIKHAKEYNIVDKNKQCFFIQVNLQTCIYSDHTKVLKVLWSHLYLCILPKRGLAFHHKIHGLFSWHRIPKGTGTFTEKHLYLGYVSLLIFMIFKSSCIGFKSRESPGHSQTDILLIHVSIMYFADQG